jgi:hypothetical protein
MSSAGIYKLIATLQSSFHFLKKHPENLYNIFLSCSCKEFFWLTSAEYDNNLSYRKLCPTYKDKFITYLSLFTFPKQIATLMDFFKNWIWYRYNIGQVLINLITSVEITVSCLE